MPEFRWSYRDIGGHSEAGKCFYGPFELHTFDADGDWTKWHVISKWDNTVVASGTEGYSKITGEYHADVAKRRAQEVVLCL